MSMWEKVKLHLCKAETGAPLHPCKCPDIALAIGKGTVILETRILGGTNFMIEWWITKLPAGDPRVVVFDHPQALNYHDQPGFIVEKDEASGAERIGLFRRIVKP